MQIRILYVKNRQVVGRSNEDQGLLNKTYPRHHFHAILVMCTTPIWFRIRLRRLVCAVCAPLETRLRLSDRDDYTSLQLPDSKEADKPTEKQRSQWEIRCRRKSSNMAQQVLSLGSMIRTCVHVSINCIRHSASQSLARRICALSLVS